MFLLLSRLYKEKTFNINVYFLEIHKYHLNLLLHTVYSTRLLTEISKIKEQPVTVSTSKNKVFARYDVKQDTSIFFTIPYDKVGLPTR